MKSKLQQYKEFIVESKTALKQAVKHQRYKMKDIYQGLMFEQPEQKLHNAEGWGENNRRLVSEPQKAFTCIGQTVVEA